MRQSLHGRLVLVVRFACLAAGLAAPVARASMIPVSGWIGAEAIVDTLVDNPGSLTLGADLGTFMRHAQAIHLSGIASITNEVTKTSDSITTRTTSFYSAGSPPHMCSAGASQEHTFDLDQESRFLVTTTYATAPYFLNTALTFPDGHHISVSSLNGQQLAAPAGRYTLRVDCSPFFGGPDVPLLIGLSLVPEPASLGLVGLMCLVARRPAPARARHGALRE